MRCMLSVCLMCLLAATVSGQDRPLEPLPRTAMVQEAERAVFAHVMVSFRTPAQSGQWRGWDFSNDHVQNDPREVDERGLPQVASTFHPMIGPYDQTDPALAEYHCQLAKMSQIDGFMFDLGYYHRPRDEQRLQWTVDAMRAYIAAMQRYGLSGALVYEEKYHWIYNHEIQQREEAVRRARGDINAWIELFAPVQWHIGERPLVTFFSYQHQLENKGISRMKPDELAEWRDGRDPQPITLTQWLPPEYLDVHDGWKHWIQQDRQVPEGSTLRAYGNVQVVRRLLDQRYDRTRELMDDGRIELAIPAAWPGFDDSRTYGWGQGVRQTPREDGAIYELTWRYARASGMPVIQIATWNDWFESTIVEPSIEDGTTYLEKTRRFAAAHKQEAVQEANLAVPAWIYRLRKRAGDDDAAQAAADKASDLIAQAAYADAETEIEPWVERYQLDEYDIEDHRNDD